MRNRVDELITNLTTQMLLQNSEYVGSGSRRQISLRPDAVTLCQIDTLADILDQSRQMLIDELLEAAILEAIESYSQAHGPDHAEAARQGFLDAFKKRWDEHYAEGDK